MRSQLGIKVAPLLTQIIHATVTIDPGQLVGHLALIASVPLKEALPLILIRHQKKFVRAITVIIFINIP